MKIMSLVNVFFAVVMSACTSTPGKNNSSVDIHGNGNNVTVNQNNYEVLSPSRAYASGHSGSGLVSGPRGTCRIMGPVGRIAQPAGCFAGRVNGQSMWLQTCSNNGYQSGGFGYQGQQGGYQRQQPFVGYQPGYSQPGLPPGTPEFYRPGARYFYQPPPPVYFR